MNDRRLDRLVRDADPYDARIDLRGAEQTLLEEIMTAAPDVNAAPHAGDGIGRRRRWRGPVTVAVAAAAVLAVAIGVPVGLKDSDAPADREGQIVQAGDGAGQIAYTEVAVTIAKHNPRLLIDGWKATTVYGFEKDEGTIAFTRGKREIEINWYAADQYDGYYEDRLDVSKPEPITVAGLHGFVFHDSPTDLEVILPIEGAAFAMIRTDSGFADEADVRATLAQIKRVDVDTWLAALPPEIVVPGKAAEVADEILAGVPLPPGFDKQAVTDAGVNSRYHFGVGLIDGVVCGWLRDWQRAGTDGDVSGERRAVEALKTAHSWKILDEMDETGSYSEGPWQLADQVEVGDDPRTYLEWFGSCEASQ